MAVYNYDVVVLGSGPAGEGAATFMRTMLAGLPPATVPAFPGYAPMATLYPKPPGTENPRKFNRERILGGCLAGAGARV